MNAELAEGTIPTNYDDGPFGEVTRATGPLSKVNPIKGSVLYFVHS
jgi:hypothetical protein